MCGFRSYLVALPYLRLIRHGFTISMRQRERERDDVALVYVSCMNAHAHVIWCRQQAHMFIISTYRQSKLYNFITHERIARHRLTSVSRVTSRAANDRVNMRRHLRALKSASALSCASAHALPALVTSLGVTVLDTFQEICD